MVGLKVSISGDRMRKGQDILELDKVVEILKSHGARRIILFGSRAKEINNIYSDIDIACEGLASEIFFKVLGEILSSVNRDVDLVDLKDVRATVRSRIEKEGVLLYEAL